MASRLLAFLGRCPCLRRLVGRRSSSAPRLGPASDAECVGDKTLPAFALRGLRKPSWVDADWLIDGEAFWPDQRNPRPNGDTETSINWEDDASVRARTLADASGRYGAARLPLAEVAHAMRRESTAGALFAERTRKLGNPYHGDIVFRAGCIPRQRKMIATSLAVASAFIQPAPPR